MVINGLCSALGPFGHAQRSPSPGPRNPLSLLQSTPPRWLPHCLVSQATTGISQEQSSCVLLPPTRSVWPGLPILPRIPHCAGRGGGSGGQSKIRGGFMRNFTRWKVHRLCDSDAEMVGAASGGGPGVRGASGCPEGVPCAGLCEPSPVTTQNPRDTRSPAHAWRSGERPRDLLGSTAAGGRTARVQDWQHGSLSLHCIAAAADKPALKGPAVWGTTQAVQRKKHSDLKESPGQKHHDESGG